MLPIRTGLGIDVHRFKPGRKLRLCGVDIPSPVGLLGHSDADVALHALCDALLGAAGLRDIGYYFPDTDPELEGIDSRRILERVVALLADAGWQATNVDITICAQAPKLMPHIDAMRQSVAEIVGTDVDAVAVKATTTEHLGFTGRKEGIAAFANVLIQPR
ncbi:MAG: 2-C-methyl-D-erythritol 2,4-cyclodiphosphate synthase [Lepagella sp.]